MRWAARTFGASASLSCSFGGPSGMVLIHILATESMPFNVYFIDTGFLFPETHELAREVKARYGIDPRRFFPRLSPAQQIASTEDALWKSDPDLCCQIRKVEPNGRALEGKQAWISGLRRDQSKGRASVGVVEWDAKFGIVKLNPLAAWAEADIWAYVREHDVPYNPLHDAGFPSAGCTYCTRAVKPGEDPRAGRWADSSKDECGLHADTMAGREAEIRIP